MVRRRLYRRVVRPKPEAPVRHRVEYGAFLAFKGLVRALPHAWARPLGRAVGDVIYRLDWLHRRVALENLERALPELSREERRRITRACFQHFGAVAADTLSISRFDLVGLCRRLTLEGWEHLEAAEARGKGVFITSGHLGNWEVAAYPVGIYRGPFHVFSRPPNNPRFAREMQRIRERFGNTLLPKRVPALEILRILQSGGRVGLLIDQRVHPNEGILVPFFGQPAVTSPLPAILSLRSGAPVVPLFGLPEPRGRYRVVVGPAIEPEGSGAAAVVALTRQYLEVVEEEIRRHPEMWLWMHRRWRV